MWVCDSGRAGGLCPNLTTANARAVFASLGAFFIESVLLTLFGEQLSSDPLQFGFEKKFIHNLSNVVCALSNGGDISNDLDGP